MTRRTPDHLARLGGWAHPVQGPVELEAAEALRWRPLLQVDSDDAAGTSWGDAGCLYWLARTDGTSPPRDADVGFTWQCG